MALNESEGNAMGDDAIAASTIENLVRRHVEGAGIDLLRTTPAKGDLPYTVVVDIPAAMRIDDAVTVFRSCGPILRRHVADTPGGWAWAVLAMRDLQPIGVHWGGWDGRDDAWVAKPPRAEGSESMEWRRVYDAVRERLAPLGRDDAFGDGEYCNGVRLANRQVRLPMARCLTPYGLTPRRGRSPRA